MLSIALQILDRDRRGEGNRLGNLGSAYVALGETRKAIEYYQQQLKITQEIGDRGGEGNSLWNMSLALDGLCKRSEAVKLAGEALAIYEQIESPAAEQVRQQLAEWQGYGGNSGRYALLLSIAGRRKLAEWSIAGSVGDDP